MRSGSGGCPEMTSVQLPRRRVKRCHHRTLWKHEVVMFVALWSVSHSRAVYPTGQSFAAGVRSIPLPEASSTVFQSRFRTAIIAADSAATPR